MTRQTRLVLAGRATLVLAAVAILGAASVVLAEEPKTKADAVSAVPAQATFGDVLARVTAQAPFATNNSVRGLAPLARQLLAATGQNDWAALLRLARGRPPTSYEGKLALLAIAMATVDKPEIDKTLYDRICWYDGLADYAVLYAPLARQRRLYERLVAETKNEELIVLGLRRLSWAGDKQSLAVIDELTDQMTSVSRLWSRLIEEAAAARKAIQTRQEWPDRERAAWIDQEVSFAKAVAEVTPCQRPFAGEEMMAAGMKKADGPFTDVFLVAKIEQGEPLAILLAGSWKVATAVKPLAELAATRPGTAQVGMLAIEALLRIGDDQALKTIEELFVPGQKILNGHYGALLAQVGDQGSLVLLKKLSARDDLAESREDFKAAIATLAKRLETRDRP